MATHSHGYKTMLGVSVKPETVKALDEFRGEVPRSRVVERALNEYLSANTMTTGKNLQGSRLETPVSQAEAASTTPTTTHAGTLEVDSLRHMATTKGSQRAGGDEVTANEQC